MGIWDDDEQADKNSAASGDQQSPPRQGEQPEGKACDKGSEPLRLIASLLSTEGGRGPIHEEIDEFKRLLDEDFLAFASQEHEDLPDEAVAHNILDDIHMKLLTLAECPQLSRRTIVAVAGGFSSGKSSFLNAFLGLDGSLPVDTRPTTVIPTFVTKGDRSRISVLNKFGCDVELNKDGFRAISHQFKEDYGIGFTMILQHAILTLDEFAYNNLAFIDTPGYTKAEGKKVAGDNTDEQSARRQVAEADALLWFMDVENGTVQEEDVRFLKSVLEEVRQQRDGHEMPVYFIFNKADKKTPSAVDDVCRKGIEILVEKGIAFAGLSAYSKRMGELFKSGEGIAAFLESIDKPSDDRPKLERELRGVFDKYREHHKAKLASERLNLAVLNKLAIIQEDSQDEEELRGLASETGDSLDGLIDKKKKLIHTVQSLIIPGIVDIEAKFNKQMDTILDAVYREEAIIDAPAPKASRKGKDGSGWEGNTYYWPKASRNRKNAAKLMEEGNQGTSQENASQPRAELSIEGLYGYHLIDDQITVSVAEIHNHRSADNLSGSLALEVWALYQPWCGGSLNGVLLASAIIGRVSGQHYLENVRVEMPFSGPSKGTWTLALALREWNGHGHDTHDLMNFAAPFVVAGSVRTCSGPSAATKEWPPNICSANSGKKAL